MKPEQARNSLTRSLDAIGAPVILRRLSGALAGDYSVRARIVEAQPSDLSGSIQQLRRKAIISAEDVETSGFPTPFLPKQDRLVWNDKALTITSIDEATRRIQGTLIAYELELSGA